ncbi:hypothetical protein Salat_1903200 [Sesamum alatum]|uniref:Uncharacterized protein n=1 Tax=Sesamum alatum TaxID=300844 RepID=A0AAE1Y3T4_9LAMI|nr:hypothetical protein Salat_1903200 [Sesamum alatum]
MKKANENARMYKERTKTQHESHIGKKKFKERAECPPFTSQPRRHRHQHFRPPLSHSCRQLSSTATVDRSLLVHCRGPPTRRATTSPHRCDPADPASFAAIANPPQVAPSRHCHRPSDR